MARFINPPDNTFLNFFGARNEARARVVVLSREFGERAANRWNKKGGDPFDLDAVAAETTEKVAEALWDVQGRLDARKPTGESVSFFIIAERGDAGNIEVSTVNAETPYEPRSAGNRFVSAFYWERVKVRTNDGTVDAFMVN